MAYGFDVDKSPDNADTDDDRSEEDDVLVSGDEDDQVTSKGMVPLADLLNASVADNNVCSFATFTVLCFADLGAVSTVLRHDKFDYESYLTNQEG